MTKQELDKLMLRLQRGDESAFEQIYNDTKRGLFAFIMSICRNYQTAEDMMQTAYIRLRTTISNYRAGSNAYAWLYTIAKNATINELNRSKRERATESFEDDAKYGTYSIDEEREIVTLHAISGFKHREIAEMTGRPVGSVIWAYNNALAKLKKELQKEDEYEN